MNVLLWVLQLALALHTAAGAMFKLAKSEQTVPSLHALPHAVWTGMAVVDALCVLALIVPVFRRRLGVLAPVAAVFIAAEMLLITGVHFASGAGANEQVTYWLVVAAVCAFIAYGRFALRPVR
jgi:hypothetical protein